LSGVCAWSGPVQHVLELDDLLELFALRGEGRRRDSDRQVPCSRRHILAELLRHHVQRARRERLDLLQLHDGGVEELILRTVVVQFDGRVVEVFGDHSNEAVRAHVAR